MNLYLLGNSELRVVKFLFYLLSRTCQPSSNLFLFIGGDTFYG